MTPAISRLVAWVCAASLLPALASAQMPSQPSDNPQPASERRPYRGLFGVPADATIKQSLDLTASVFNAFDDNVFADAVDTTLPANAGQPPYSGQRNGWYTGMNAGLAYNRPGERVRIGLTGDVGAHRYYERDETAPIYRTAAAIGVRPWSRTSFRVTQSFVYAPDYRLGLFVSPDSPTGPLDPFTTISPDLNIYNLAAYHRATTVGVSQRIGRRASADGWYNLAVVDYVDQPYDYTSRGAGFRYGQQLTRNLSLRFGYSYHDAEYREIDRARPQLLHNIDAGVHYGRALSFSRRTSVSFSTGSALLATGQSTVDRDGEGLRFAVTGGANLTHEMGRTWTAAIAYRRGADFHEGFTEPFLSDGVTASLDGFLSRRLRFRSSVDYSIGTVGIGTDDHFNSGAATAGLELALSRNLALFGRYVYYQYEFDSQLAIDPRFSQSLERQGIRLGLSLFVPLVRERGRRGSL
jgi:opacity protein-like surface antigen